MEKMDSKMDMNAETICRACANTCVRCYAINSKVSNYATTIKEMIVLLVPQMDTELDDNDVICNSCRRILRDCAKFVDQCLRVEANRKDNISYLKSCLDTAPITILEDGVIKKEPDTFSDVDEKDTNGSYLNGDFENDEKTDQVVDIKSENNHGIVEVQNNLPTESLPSYNRLIFAKQICPDNLNELMHILSSNDVKTIRLSQDSARSTEQKRVILIGSTFKCSKCFKYFSPRWKYKKHLGAHKKVEQRRQERERMKKLKMQKVEERKAQKRRRQKNSAERKQRAKPAVELDCRTCSEKFPSIEDLELHLKIHPPYVCETCGKGFAKREQICAHKLVHNEQNSYVCEVCGKGFKTNGQLRSHALRHDDTLHSCKKCGKVFSGAVRLKSHMKLLHAEGRGIWTCKECGKVFKRACLYQTHYGQIHLRDGNKKCDICGQGFYRRDYLVRHKRRHVLFGETLESLDNDGATLQTGESVSNGTEIVRKRRIARKPRGFRGRPAPLPPGPYQCQICLKAYKALDNLKRHIPSHGRARFSCNSCSRTYKDKYQLNRHEKVQHKSDLSGKYKCGICWKRFEIQEDLDQHCITHSNFKHKCELCGESFAREHLLKDHIANFHAEDDDGEEEMRILMETGLGTSLFNFLNM